MSKMQELVDKAREENKAGNPSKAIDSLIEAIILLSRAHRQTMIDFERAQGSRTDMRIASE